MILIGIDPAFRVNGFGLCSIDKKEKTVHFHKIKKFTDFIGYLKNDIPADKVKFCIENSNLQNMTFDMSGSRAELARKSRNVGANQAVSQIVVDLCREAVGKANVIELSPAQKGRKKTGREMQLACMYLGLKLPFFKTKPTQDNIDAFMLAHYLWHRS